MPCWTFTYPEGDKKKAELKKTKTEPALCCGC